MNGKLSSGTYEFVESVAGNGETPARFLTRFRVVEQPSISVDEKNSRWVRLDCTHHSEASVRVAASDWIRHMNETTFGTYKLLEC